MKKDWVKMIKSCVLPMVLVALVSGCASTGQVVPMPDQSKPLGNAYKSRIYVVRPSMFGGAIPMRVFDTKKHIGHTGPKSYLCWDRSPGRAEIHSGAENTSKLQLVCKPGETYYILQRVKMGAAFARCQLEMLSDEDGRKYVSKCKPAKIE